jgi:double-stranded uracil-DNA glycosylase
MKSIGFNAIASPEARVLILGTLPSVKSLEQGEYYAHARNSFWWIMGELIVALPALAYEERTRRLQSSGIALWDVCRAAERPGSSDANIRLPTIEPNDFRAFFSRHRRIELICFNGHPAEKLFCGKVAPHLPVFRSIPHRVLVSTSPACARFTREEKLACWRAALEPFIHARRSGLQE